MIVGLGINKLKSMSVRSWKCTSLRLPQSSFCSEGAPQKGKSDLCLYVCYDRCIWLPVVFSYFFCQSFVDTVAFWCHPSTCCEDKGIE